MHFHGDSVGISSINVNASAFASDGGGYPYSSVVYLITLACYGSHLHGDESGSVDRRHAVPGAPMLEPNFNRSFAARRSMLQGSYTMDRPRRDTVLASLVERCSNRGWSLLAAHVRTNHLHIVLDAEAAPERIMNDLKSYASRMLNLAGFDTPDRKRWARHGSTRRLAERENVEAAIRYALEKQGDPMATFLAPDQH